MDPLTALGIAASVAQFVTLGSVVTKRLLEFMKASPGEVPSSLINISTQLPLLVNALSRAQSERQVNQYDEDTQVILHGVVLGCLKLVHEVDGISKRILPQQGDNVSAKLKKMMISLKKDDRISEIEHGLQGYIQVLIFHHVVDRGEMPQRPSEEEPFFEVKEKRVSKPVQRETLLRRLDECFHTVVRSQVQEPVYVTLQGGAGVGKTQLALEYCYQAYEFGHFHTIFWLTASSPPMVIVGIESIASVIRRTKAGSTKEKIDFVNNFLAERCRPWLVVLDDYEKEAFGTTSIIEHLPQIGHGAILVLTRDRNTIAPGTIISVHQYLTPSEARNRRRTITEAVESKDIDQLRDALDDGFDINSYSHDFFGNDRAPIVNKAAEVGFDDAVRLLLERGADMHFDKKMGTLLGDAIRSGQLSTVSLCLDWQDRIGYQYQSYDNVFQAVIRKGDPAILQCLLARRGEHLDPNNRPTGEAFVEAACGGNLGILRILISSNKLPIVPILISDILRGAIEKSHLDVLNFLLSTVRINPNLLTSCRRTPLYHATDVDRYNPSSYTRDSLVTALISAPTPADPNIPNSSNRATPLHQAAFFGQVSTIPLLLAHGASLTAENADGANPLLTAASQRTTDSYHFLTESATTLIPDPETRILYFNKALYHAARHNDRLLALSALNAGFIDPPDPNPSNPDAATSTPLLVALAGDSDSLPLARLLIRRGARRDVRTPPTQGSNTPLHLAAERGYDGLIRDLLASPLSKGPAPATGSVGIEVEVDVRNANEETPLILAARGGHAKAVAVLLENGADRDAEDRFGETAGDVVEDAMREGNGKGVEGEAAREVLRLLGL